jgi:hypothetical protein
VISGSSRCTRVPFATSTETLLTLFRSKPMSQVYSQVPHALDAADPGGKIGAEQDAIGGLIRQAPHRAKSKIDSAGANCRISRWLL